MNKAILVGRLARDPEVKYIGNDKPLCITSYTLAVDRIYKKGEADFIKCKAFGRSGEFAEKYFKKGMRVGISGRIETGSYMNRDGQKVYTTEVIVEEQEIAQSKNEAKDIPGFEGVSEEMQRELPFV